VSCSVATFKEVEIMAAVTVATHRARQSLGQRLLRILYGKISERANVFRQARELAGLLPNERVLAKGWAEAKPLMVTDRAFYWGLRSASTRIGWEQIARADWDPESHTLTILGLLPGVPRKLTFALDSPELAPLVADRVAASHALTTRVELDGHGSALVVARRKPGTEELVWLVSLAAGTSPHAPGVATAVDRALAELCREIKIS
jgi:hypothetical protein